MAQRISTNKLAGGVLLGAVASGLAAAALSGAGTANATCASISGIGNSTTPGNTCTSTAGSFAVGLGSGVQARSNGLFDGAVAVGPNNGPNDFTAAQSTGNLNFAYAQGTNAIASAGFQPSDTGNVAINIANSPTGTFSEVDAGGQGTTPGIANLAVNLGGTSDPVTGFTNVEALGTGNVAINVGGVSNGVSAGALSPTGGTLTSAFNLFGSNNVVVTGAGPFAVAGTIGVNNHQGATLVRQIGPGFNIKTPLNP
jgi:hypothetical protein